MDKYLYLTINLASILVPFLASFYPKHPFYKEWISHFLANTIVAILFIIWDIIFTNYGVWSFNPRYLLGTNFYSIPLEEVFFFFFIPYSSVFVYFALNYLSPSNPFEKYANRFTVFLFILLLSIGILFWNRLYTSITFILSACFLIFCYFRKINLANIYRAYLFILLPFFIVNGILTGSFIEEPVVKYNNAQNLGIRLGTIPFEDVFYGFLLIAATIQLSEFFKIKIIKK